MGFGNALGGAMKIILAGQGHLDILELLSPNVGDVLLNLGRLAKPRPLQKILTLVLPPRLSG